MADGSTNAELDSQRGAGLSLDDGSVRCWGYNGSGTLGQGHTNNIGDDPGEMPPPDVDVGGPVAQLSVGASHSCVLLDSGAVRCWGYNGEGGLGQEHTNNIGDDPGEMPPPDVDVGPGVVTKIVAGRFLTCALFEAGQVRCWGSNQYGTLGQGNTEHLGDQPGEMPAPLVDVGGAVVDLIVGRNACALLDDGAVRCWGFGQSGLNGQGSSNHLGDQPGEMPPADIDLGGPVSQLGGGCVTTRHCVGRVDGTVRCWGFGQYGLGYATNNSIGDGLGEMPPEPVPVF